MTRIDLARLLGVFLVGSFAFALSSCSSSSSPRESSAFGTHPTSTTTSTSSTSTSSSSTATGASRGAIPITVESDVQMQAEGNNGPSSSVLLPTSCQVVGTTVTATGVAQGVSEVYDRYGDIIELYLFTPPSNGYQQGEQLAASSYKDAPPVGAGGWEVSTSFDPSVGQPARCVVAAQPTHDVQLAP